MATIYVREGVRARESPEKALPLPGQAFLAFLGTLLGGWSSVTMHGFTAGDYLLQTTKDRMLLIPSMRRMLQLQGESGCTGYNSYLRSLTHETESDRYCSCFARANPALQDHTDTEEQGVEETEMAAQHA